MWLRVEGLKESLKSRWQSLRFNGSFIFILAVKLNALKVIFKSWIRDVFSMVEVNNSKALLRVSYWDDQEEYNSLPLEETEERNLVRDWSLLEEVYGGRNLENFGLKRVIGIQNFFIEWLIHIGEEFF